MPLNNEYCYNLIESFTKIIESLDNILNKLE